jgi:deazaflavin-dependent oxidoreductase (nitroreductase family)
MRTTTLSHRDRTKTAIMRRVGATHRTVFRLTGGKLGRRWFGGEVLLLTVVGRRSGRAFTVTLMFVRDGEDFIVAASNGGVDREPQWWLNLQALPQAEAQVGAKRVAVTASQVDDADRPALWEQLGEAYRGFASYQAGVQRQIAVVRLRPAGVHLASTLNEALPNRARSEGGGRAALWSVTFGFVEFDGAVP